MSDVHDSPPDSGEDPPAELPKFSFIPGDISLPDSNDKISNTTVPPFKFSKTVSIDEIMNVDADLVDFDSFQYLRKDTLVKALLYMIKNVHQINQELSSVTVPESADFGCQLNGAETGDLSYKDSSTANPPKNSSDCTQNQVVLQNVLENFQANLLKCVDARLSAVDDKLSDAITQFSSNNDIRIRSFSEVAAQAAKNVESIAKTTIDNVQKSMNVVNSVPVTSASENQLDTSSIYISNDTTLKSQNSPNSEVMVLTPTNPSTAYLQSKLDSAKKSLQDKLKKVPFEFANNKSKTGKIALRFPTPQAYSEAEKVIDTNFLASAGFESKKARKMLPKITLRGVPGHIFENVVTTDLDEAQIRYSKKHELITQVKEKNPCINDLVIAGHTCQVVFINKQSNSSDVNVGLKVSPLIRSTVLAEQNGYVFIGSKRCLFNDRFDVGQCYHCQLLGHSSKDCPNKNMNSTCLYCMGDHRSSSCPHKNQVDKHCCAKCHNSTEGNDATNYESHNSASPNCPVYVRECQRLANITDFASKNVM